MYLKQHGIVPYCTQGRDWPILEEENRTTIDGTGSVYILHIDLNDLLGWRYASCCLLGRRAGGGFQQSSIHPADALPASTISDW